MGNTISENLQIIKNSTDAIRQAIINKGGTIEGDISTWASVIESLGGGSSNGPGAVFKITNKLDGELIGGPNPIISNYHIHTYEFEGGTLKSNTLFPLPDDEFGISFPSASLYPSQLMPVNTGNSHISCINSDEILAGTFSIGVTFNGELWFAPNSGEASVKPLPIMYIASDSDGNYDIDTFYVQGGYYCFAKNTLITLSDYSTKQIQDITYNDDLLVWNFDDCKYDSAKPMWIKKTQKASYYYNVTLDDGTTIKLVGSNGKCHRLFCVEDNKFISATDMVNKTTYTQNGNRKVVSCEVIEESVEFYNIITQYHMNMFANGILSSCRYNNLYPIENMKFIKDDRINNIADWELYKHLRDYRELDGYINGLRLYEQIDIPLEDTIKYCSNLKNSHKTIDDFDNNKIIINEIEDTQMGWIDREGNCYGFKIYMSGQHGHAVLADKICKLLNIETNNPLRYLSQEGWLRYTTDYVFNTNDVEINDNQLNTLCNFINTPNKLKEQGKIKIGNYKSDYTDVSEFKKMDKYSFEYRKKRSLMNI